MARKMKIRENLNWIAADLEKKCTIKCNSLEFGKISLGLEIRRIAQRLEAQSIIAMVTSTINERELRHFGQLHTREAK